MKRGLCIKMKPYTFFLFASQIEFTYPTIPQEEVYLVAVGQEAALLYVAHKAQDWNVIQDKLEVKKFLDGLTKFVHLRHTKRIHNQTPFVSQATAFNPTLC